MYFITCFEKISIDKLGWLDIGSQRTFGYKETFEMAKLALNENWCDMREYVYNFAIVEKIPSGIHPDVEEMWFFKWDENKKGFFEIPEPEEYNHFCNIAFG